jgi:hypothetical protein
MKRQPTIAELLVGVGGGVTVLFSFFGVVRIGTAYPGAVNAWGTGAFPLATIPAVLGLASCAYVALGLFTDVRLPERVLSFTWPQILVTWGITASAVTLAYAMVDKAGGSLAVGGWLMLFGSLTMAAGAIATLTGKGGQVVHLVDRAAATPASSTADATGPLPPPAPGTRPGTRPGAAPEDPASGERP